MITRRRDDRARGREGCAGPRAHRLKLAAFRVAMLTALSFAALANCSGPRVTPGPRNVEGWEDKFSKIVWVCYSPPSSDPTRGVEATPEAISDDLAVLRRAGFTGLITYGSAGVLGRELPALAKSRGFEGLIIGVWDPANRDEMEAAVAASANPVVLGYCVGNEGLQSRYQLPALYAAIDEVRRRTGRPATTTEIVERYADKNLLRLGDWVFPNAHPYFHNQLVPADAVRWTKTVYDDLKRRGGRFLMFKEVGLPTAGDAKGELSEETQESYYLELAKTDVRYAYFEAFDQPWKTHLPVEPHWGIFKADRSPKRLARRLVR
jgi:exo-beta-1,3-glucanase (GH17 family)